ncbi:protein lifeguard 1 [Erpetoichthys calabaricus]|uniref:Si:ch211-284o19.8 n=1 Tax=Erpetoichthys calabaricus TaxID=27687 RepID=A0A8C4RPP6_ERPCA|nr:protein lifeguard 1 [Erpetoichthys calabaricus]
MAETKSDTGLSEKDAVKTEVGQSSYTNMAFAYPEAGEAMQVPPPPSYMPPSYQSAVCASEYANKPEPSLNSNYNTINGPDTVVVVTGNDALPPGCVEVVATEYEDKSVRRAFIRKVFAVVTMQLLVTFGIVCIFTFANVVKNYIKSNIWVYITSYCVFAVVAIVLQFGGSLRRRFPWNIIALGVVTLSLSFMVGAVASFHDTTAVIIALGSTVIISFTIIIFSAQSRISFSICNGILIVLAVDLMMFGFFSIFFYSTMLQILYGCLGALVFALFLAIDVQLVIGRESYALSPEEYIFAALAIYLDIILIFLYLLILFGGGKK